MMLFVFPCIPYLRTEDKITDNYTCMKVKIDKQ